MERSRTLFSFLVIAALAWSGAEVPAAFATTSPLVMLALSKDATWFREAYPDNTDLNSDGALETTYVDALTYAGYFHPRLCYRYDDANKRFQPAGWNDGTMNHHYCSGVRSDSFSGNFLNWATMTRIDVLRRSLYGGLRSVDTNAATVLERAQLPPDSHSFAKYYNGADLNKLTPFDTVKTDTTNGGNQNGFDDNNEGITLCNTSYDAVITAYSHASTAPPVVRIVYGNRQLWDTNERWQCTWETERGDNFNGNQFIDSGIDATSSDPPATLSLLTSGGAQDRVVRVLACDPIFFDANDDAEQCRLYPSGGRKPIGVLQRYGELGQIKFGLVSGSWDKNLSGGALRKNPGDLSDEINVTTDGSFKLVTAASGSIINTLNLMRLYGYRYADGVYFPTPDNCGFQLSIITESNCRSWGNPLAEIYLETARYFAVGSGRAPTPGFDPNDLSSFPASAGGPGMVDLPWTSDPQAGLAEQPALHILVINSGTQSYDNATSSTILGANTPQVLTNAIAAIENNNSSPFPNASYHLAGIAHYARTHDLRSTLPGTQSINTIGLELPPYEPSIAIPIGPLGTQIFVRVVPTYRLIFNNTGGSLIKLKVVRSHTEVDPSDRSRPGLPNTTTDGIPDISVGGVPSVNFPVAKAGTGIFHGKFYVLWDDSAQGGDVDQDSTGTIDYVVNTNVNPPTITITTKTIAQSSASAQLFGFNISGTTEDGFHAYSGILGANATDAIAGIPGCNNCRALSEAGGQRGQQSYTFTAASNPSKVVETPLYYAAKWGGFVDSNADGRPDLITEWDGYDGNGVPDNYSRITDPAAMSGSLTTALARLVGGATPDFDNDGLPDALDPDDDNDGMPDIWELAQQLNPLNAADAFQDPDGDGRSNLAEYQGGTDPQVADSPAPDFDQDGIPDAIDLDDDNDGMPDEWENAHQLNPFNATDASLDPDGDGLSNLAEYQGGTDPHVSNLPGPDFDGDGIPDATDPDDDNDGMPDIWEIAHQLDPLNAADAALDPDGDGRSNLNEYKAGTDPHVVDQLPPDFDGDGIPDITDLDDDNDGMPDSWELSYSFNPRNASDAVQDTDGDGISNLDEFRAGTDPRVANSLPSLPPVQLVLNVHVSLRQTPAGNDSAFVPFDTQVKLNFDPTWVSRTTGGANDTAAFVGNNHFDSPLSALVPWRPPALLAPERRLLIVENLLSPPLGQAYWDDRYYFADSAAQREYRYGVSLGGGLDQSLYVQDMASFKSAQLLSYLEARRAAGTSFEYRETASVYDGVSHQYISNVNYVGTAKIATVTNALTDFDSDGIPDSTDPDDDNDGVPDDWEIAHQLNPFDAADASADPDGDGRSNLIEYQQGTDPQVGDSAAPKQVPLPPWALAALGIVLTTVGTRLLAPMRN